MHDADEAAPSPALSNPKAAPSREPGDTSGHAASAAAAIPEPEPTGDLIFETLWGRVVETWDDEKAHSAFLDYAIRAERLPDAAGRYRIYRDDPEKGEKAKKKLGAVVLAAESLLMTMKTPRATKLPWQVTASAIAASFILLFWLAYAILRP